ncbi:hypothetical protein [Clostridium fungisolvens]|uniref:Uncharacterized protein n=1 Tax=Clostridium fungisolvens TaxID=1604897 RepID=A0A6V8SFX1_9CLOT|nr:hypothetical protein [Clostridium fungisolvens]GFP75606.1 hypothetical protein bsdtw1_01693 [Clostridium fungisolvens]
MKKNNWGAYFLYAVVFFCYIVLSNKLLISFNKEKQMTFQIMPLILWSMFIFILLGLLLGLEKLILERKKDGNWKINLPKLIFLGIPFLYLSLGVLIYYSSLIPQVLSYPIQFFLQDNINFFSIFQVILGYVISSSFIKVED